MALNFRRSDRNENFLPVRTAYKCIRGYHVYRHIRSAAVREVLFCEKEPTNSRCGRQEGRCSDRTLPRKVSRVCSLFTRRGGTISYRVSGRRRYSSDLPAITTCLASQPYFFHARKKNTAGSITTRSRRVVLIIRCAIISVR